MNLNQMVHKSLGQLNDELGEMKKLQRTIQSLLLGQESELDTKMKSEQEKLRELERLINNMDLQQQNIKMRLMNIIQSYKTVVNSSSYYEKIQVSKSTCIEGNVCWMKEEEKEGNLESTDSLIKYCPSTTGVSIRSECADMRQDLQELYCIVKKSINEQEDWLSNKRSELLTNCGKTKKTNCDTSDIMSPPPASIVHTFHTYPECESRTAQTDHTYKAKIVRRPSSAPDEPVQELGDSNNVSSHKTQFHIVLESNQNNEEPEKKARSSIEIQQLPMKEEQFHRKEYRTIAAKEDMQEMVETSDNIANLELRHINKDNPESHKFAQDVSHKLDWPVKEHRVIVPKAGDWQSLYSDSSKSHDDSKKTGVPNYDDNGDRSIPLLEELKSDSLSPSLALHQPFPDTQPEFLGRVAEKDFSVILDNNSLPKQTQVLIDVSEIKEQHTPSSEATNEIEDLEFEQDLQYLSKHIEQLSDSNNQSAENDINEIIGRVSDIECDLFSKQPVVDSEKNLSYEVLGNVQKETQKEISLTNKEKLIMTGRTHEPIQLETSTELSRKVTSNLSDQESISSCQIDNISEELSSFQIIQENRHSNKEKQSIPQTDDAGNKLTPSKSHKLSEKEIQYLGVDPEVYTTNRSPTTLSRDIVGPSNSETGNDNSEGIDISNYQPPQEIETSSRLKHSDYSDTEDSPLEETCTELTSNVAEEKSEKTKVSSLKLCLHSVVSFPSQFEVLEQRDLSTSLSESLLEKDDTETLEVSECENGNSSLEVDDEVSKMMETKKSHQEIDSASIQLAVDKHERQVQSDMIEHKDKENQHSSEKTLDHEKSSISKNVESLFENSNIAKVGDVTPAESDNLIYLNEDNLNQASGSLETVTDVITDAKTTSTKEEPRTETETEFHEKNELTDAIPKYDDNLEEDSDVIMMNATNNNDDKPFKLQKSVEQAENLQKEILEESPKIYDNETISVLGSGLSKNSTNNRISSDVKKDVNEIELKSPKHTSEKEFSKLQVEMILNQEAIDASPSYNSDILEQSSRFSENEGLVEDSMKQSANSEECKTAIDLDEIRRREKLERKLPCYESDLVSVNYIDSLENQHKQLQLNVSNFPQESEQTGKEQDFASKIGIIGKLLQDIKLTESNECGESNKVQDKLECLGDKANPQESSLSMKTESTYVSSIVKSPEIINKTHDSQKMTKFCNLCVKEGISKPLYIDKDETHVKCVANNSKQPSEKLNSENDDSSVEFNVKDTFHNLIERHKAKTALTKTEYPVDYAHSADSNEFKVTAADQNLSPTCSISTSTAVDTENTEKHEFECSSDDNSYRKYQEIDEEIGGKYGLKEKEDTIAILEDTIAMLENTEEIEHGNEDTSEDQNNKDIPEIKEDEKRINEPSEMDKREMEVIDESVRRISEDYTKIGQDFEEEYSSDTIRKDNTKKSPKTEQKTTKPPVTFHEVQENLFVDKGDFEDDDETMTISMASEISFSVDHFINTTLEQSKQRTKEVSVATEFVTGEHSNWKPELKKIPEIVVSEVDSYGCERLDNSPDLTTDDSDNILKSYSVSDVDSHQSVWNSDKDSEEQLTATQGSQYEATNHDGLKNMRHQDNVVKESDDEVQSKIKSKTSPSKEQKEYQNNQRMQSLIERNLIIKSDFESFPTSLQNESDQIALSKSPDSSKSEDCENIELSKLIVNNSRSEFEDRLTTSLSISESQKKGEKFQDDSTYFEDMDDLENIEFNSMVMRPDLQSTDEQLSNYDNKPTISFNEHEDLRAMNATDSELSSLVQEIDTKKRGSNNNKLSNLSPPLSVLTGEDGITSTTVNVPFEEESIIPETTHPGENNVVEENTESLCVEVVKGELTCRKARDSAQPAPSLVTHKDYTAFQPMMKKDVIIHQIKEPEPKADVNEPPCIEKFVKNQIATSTGQSSHLISSLACKCLSNILLLLAILVVLMLLVVFVSLPYLPAYYQDCYLEHAQHSSLYISVMRILKRINPISINRTTTGSPCCF